MSLKNLGILALVALSGCATYLDAQRDQRVLYTVQAPQAGTSLLDVSVPDDVIARAPNDFSNMTGLIAKTMRDYVELKGQFVALDKSDLGFHAKWERTGNDPNNLAAVRVRSLEGVPAGIQTPLVTVARVVDWRTSLEQKGKDSVDVAHVELIMSTWTREGTEVLTEHIDALARSDSPFLFLKAGDHHLVTWFQKSDGHEPFMKHPANRAELFMNVIREAVGVHYYPYFAHKVAERMVLVDDEPLKPGVQAALRGNFDEALQAWVEVAAKDPKAHGALYNAALMHLIKGDDEGALGLLEQAYKLEDKFLYGGVMDDVKARIAMRKTVGPGGSVQPGAVTSAH